ncbi:MAG TPA: hypothetical protein VFR09_06185 [Alphaproteobacteria bacterium]|nr:hypothetical protein [Alphaproteobacteria bacterium]
MPLERPISSNDKPSTPKERADVKPYGFIAITQLRSTCPSVNHPIEYPVVGIELKPMKFGSKSFFAVYSWSGPLGGDDVTPATINIITRSRKGKPINASAETQRRLVELSTYIFRQAEMICEGTSGQQASTPSAPPSKPETPSRRNTIIQQKLDAMYPSFS